jgi:integrase
MAQDKAQGQSRQTVVVKPIRLNNPTRPLKKSRKRRNGTGSIYWNKAKNSYQASAKDIHGKTHSPLFPDPESAQRWLYEQQSARERGLATYSRDPNLTVSEMLLKWVERYNQRNKSPNTYRNYCDGIKNRINPYIGDIKANKLTPHKVEELFGILRTKGLSESTIKNTEQILSIAYNSALRKKDLPYSPMSDVEKIKVEGWQSPTAEIPQQDVQKIYVEASKDPFLHARIEVALMLGLRPGEILALKWADVDFANNTIKVIRQVQRVTGKGLVIMPPKRKQSRPLPLSVESMKVLLKHKEIQDLESLRWNENQGWIFPNSQGRLLDEKADVRSWRILLANAGVTSKYTRYQLRKTCFSYLASSGIDLKTLMEFSGHSQSSTVLKHYVFTNEMAIRGASESLNGLRPKIDALNFTEGIK